MIMKVNKCNFLQTAIILRHRLCLLLLLIVAGCSTHSPPPPVKTLVPQGTKELARLGYTIQVGAFSQVENAARLTAKLAKKGVSPYYFRHSSGLYKVRFGNFTTLAAARRQAEYLVQTGIISDFYLVRPESYAVAQQEKLGSSYLRNKVSDTAGDFIGIPYKWGGDSAAESFDCSGLTMAVYRLNGLNLPRTSRSQFRTGRAVQKNNLKKGDLVFFATNGGRRVSHVGIYTGNNTFIHAPGKGKHIKTASLSNSYFKSRYLGARSYIGDS